MLWVEIIFEVKLYYGIINNVYKMYGWTVGLFSNECNQTINWMQHLMIQNIRQKILCLNIDWNCYL